VKHITMRRKCRGRKERKRLRTYGIMGLKLSILHANPDIITVGYALMKAKTKSTYKPLVVNGTSSIHTHFRSKHNRDKYGNVIDPSLPLRDNSVGASTRSGTVVRVRIAATLHSLWTMIQSRRQLETYTKTISNATRRQNCREKRHSTIGTPAFCLSRTWLILLLIC
jgi:hypothetical protein